jgi:transcriptional regulator with GAF, ATPase, and Fis domain
MLEVIEAAWRPDLPVLLTGASGTGKEGTARLIHHVCEARAGHGFVIVDCTTLRHELSGSELFGHVRGAFTGASIDRDGALSLANEGTLFLDEIGERTYKPVGANYWKKTDFRLVSATNRDLAAEVAAGRFRADLYYRIAGGCHFRFFWDFCGSLSN